MEQYQSFVEGTGSSDSFAKLNALKIPPLRGKSFLDMGCNEGFFCGFAHFDGAIRVVGVDKSKQAIERAQAKFPEVVFSCQSWDEPLTEKYDVILLVSALHYAEDQAALIKKAASYLKEKGTLVLELGVAKGHLCEWVKVKRSIDERLFPTQAKLAEILDFCAWKIVGFSVDQNGDPVRRVVVHIQKKRPYAFLLLAPSAYGKTTIARQLSQTPGTKAISGDLLVGEVSKGQHNVSDALLNLVRDDFSVLTISNTIHQIFNTGLGQDWVDLMLSQAQESNVIIDSYVPEDFYGLVLERVEQSGFIPILLSWNKPSEQLRHEAESQIINDEYKNYLKQRIESDGTAQESSSNNSLKNVVSDRVEKSTLSNQFPYVKAPIEFDPELYLKLHPDVKSAGMDAVEHFLRHGQYEGRRFR